VRLAHKAGADNRYFYHVSLSSLFPANIVDVAENDGNNDDQAGNNRLNVRVDFQYIHRVADNAHQDAAEKRAEYRPLPAVERHSADNRRRQRARFVTNPGVRGNRIDPGRKNNRRDRTVKTGDRIDHNFIPVNVNPGKEGVLLVSADRDDPPPEVKK